MLIAKAKGIEGKVTIRGYKQVTQDHMIVSVMTRDRKIYYVDVELVEIMEVEA